MKEKAVFGTGFALWTVVFCLWLLYCAAWAGAALVIYPTDPDHESDGKITGTLNGTSATFEYQRTYHPDFGTQKDLKCNYVRFASDGPVDVHLTVTSGTVTTANLRTVGKDLSFTRNGNVFDFTLPGPGNYYLQLPDLNVSGSATYTVYFFFDDLAKYNSYQTAFAGALNALNYGIVSSPTLNQSTAIQSFVGVAGRTCYFPAGIYRCGQIHPANDVTIYLAPGATIKGTDNYAQSRFIYANAQWNIRIAGLGAMDANGFTSSNLSVSGHMFDMESVNGVTLEDVLFRDSNSWSLHIRKCDNVLFDNVKVFSGKDGIDPDGSEDVLIKNCVVNSVDDGFAVKSKFSGYSCQRVTMQDCIVQAVASSFKIGTENYYGSVNNITWDNCDAVNADRGIIIYTKDGSGTAPIYNITWKNLRIFNFPWATESGGAPFQFSNQGPANISNVKAWNVKAWPTQSSAMVYNHFHFDLQNVIMNGVSNGLLQQDFSWIGTIWPNYTSESRPVVFIEPSTRNQNWYENGDIVTATVQHPFSRTISSVQFFVDGNSIGTDTSSPFTATLSGLSMGEHTIYAVATDQDAATNTTAPVRIQITTAPATGTIAGNVKDGGGANLSGATISTTTGGYTTTTNSSGNYTLSGVGTGTYSVVASKLGYNTSTQTGKTVTANQTTTANFTLTALSNWLTNGNFEGGFTSGVGNGWTTWAGSWSNPITFADETSIVYGGSHAQRWGRSDNQRVHGGICQSINVISGHTYRITGYLRFSATEANTWCEMGYDLTGQTSNGEASSITYTKLESGGQGVWLSYTRDVVATGSTMSVFCKFGQYNQGGSGPSWCYADDLSVYDLSGASTGAISGNVKDGSGVNLSGATVTTNTGGYTATTDANGNYTMSNVATGTYSVTASKTGYNSQTQTGKTVNAGATTTVNFTCTRQTGTISGNVKDGAGVNLSGATVSTTSGGYTTTTDASGNYTLANVVTGSYDVVASKSGYNSQTQTGKVVNNAATTTVNFTVIRQTGTIAGNVKDGGGVNLSGATVSTTSGGYTTTTDASGNYTLSSVVTGTYDVVASKSGYNSQTQTGKVVSNAATTTVNFTCTRQTGTIAGNVKDGGGVNVSGATVSTTTGGYTTTTNSSGNYTLANVATGTYDVVASKAGYNSQTQTGKVVNNAATTTVNFTITSTTIASEDFTTIPTWTSTFDAAWGSAATFASVTGGQSGNFMQASRTSQGSSSRVKVYTVPQNTNITVSIYMKCPSYPNSYWMETAFKLGSYTASDFDGNSATWTLIKKFKNTETNGNGDVWTQYSYAVNTGSNTQISIGYKHGSSGYTGPTVGWDTFRIQ